MSTTALDSETVVEITDDAAFDKMIKRLNKLSVEKHHDAFVDIPWDEPGNAIDPSDPRFRLPALDPVAGTDWYQALSPEQRSTVALYRYAACMKTGWHFENLLQRGLLLFAMRLPNGDTAFRYAHHEIIEESQHTLMFQEFVDRSGLPVRGMSRSMRLLAELAVPRVARHAQCLFFVMVVGGEDPADHLQRGMIRDGLDHPVLERIMRIHVTEEARHLSFARHFLKREVPKLGRVRRGALSLLAPAVLGVMARMMIEPPADLRRHVGMPRQVARDAFRTPEGRQLLADSVAKPRKLLAELGLLNPAARLVWKAFGVSGDAAPAADQAEAAA